MTKGLFIAVAFVGLSIAIPAHAQGNEHKKVVEITFSEEDANTVAAPSEEDQETLAAQQRLIERVAAIAQMDIPNE